MSPALYVSVSLATCVGLCRFGEAWAALRAENLLTAAASSGQRAAPQKSCEARDINGIGLPVFEYKYNVQILYGKTVFEAPVNLNLVKVPYCVSEGAGSFSRKYGVVFT